MTYQLVLAAPGLLLTASVAGHGIMGVMRGETPTLKHYALMTLAGALLTPIARM